MPGPTPRAFFRVDADGVRTLENLSVHPDNPQIEARGQRREGVRRALVLAAAVAAMLVPLAIIARGCFG